MSIVCLHGKQMSESEAEDIIDDLRTQLEASRKEVVRLREALEKIAGTGGGKTWKDDVEIAQQALASTTMEILHTYKNGCSCILSTKPSARSIALVAIPEEVKE